MDRPRILARVFEHDGKSHFFDTVTSHLYECDEVVAAVIPHLDRLGETHIREELDRRWGADRVDTALAAIKELRGETGALTPTRLEIVSLSPLRYDPAKYKDQIRHLQMTISEQCNQRCEYCPYTRGRSGSRRHRDVYMSVETALAAVDFFMSHCAAVEKPAISFYGGEPLLNFKVIQAATARIRGHSGGERFQLLINTNGVAIDERIARFLVEERFNVQLSLDGPAHIHDRYRKTTAGGGSHARVVVGLERLLAVDPEFHSHITFNAVQAPPYALSEVVDYFVNFPSYRKFGITAPPAASMDSADLSHMDFPQVPDPHGQSPTFSEALEPLEKLYKAECAAGRHDEMHPILRSLFDLDLVGYYHRPRSPLTTDPFCPTGACQPGQRKLHVRADGAFLPCERGNDYMTIGHVNSGIDLKAVEDLYRRMVACVAERCRGCWAVRRCSTCFIHMSVSWGQDGAGDIEIPEAVCAGARRSAEYAHKLYLSLEKSGPQAHEWLKKTEVK